jgi:hypothetical protein
MLLTNLGHQNKVEGLGVAGMGLLQGWGYVILCTAARLDGNQHVLYCLFTAQCTVAKYGDNVLSCVVGILNKVKDLVLVPRS